MTFLSIKEKFQRFCGERSKMPSDKTSFWGYKKAIDTQKYSLFLPPYLCNEIVAAHGTAILIQKRHDTPFFTS